MKVHSNLKKIMKDRHMTVAQLTKRAAVGHESISNLRTNTSKRVSINTLGRICGVLNVSLSDLLRLDLEDIWTSIKRSGEVTIHYGSRSLPDRKPAHSNPDRIELNRQYVGTWDMRSLSRIYDHLKSLGVEIKVVFEEHFSDAENLASSSVSKTARRMLERGNHIVIGAPTSNQLAEAVVCHAFGVSPYTPGAQEKFPYGFAWDADRQALSSFGWRAEDGEFGIRSQRTGQLVARFRLVQQGEGEDCGLIMTHRLFQPQALRVQGDADERIIIAILGYSGPGTLAAAEAAIQSKFAADLWPPDPPKAVSKNRPPARMPLLRAVSATYVRPPAKNPRDNRELTGVELVPADPPANAEPEDAEDDASPSKRRPSKVARGRKK